VAVDKVHSREASELTESAGTKLLIPVLTLSSLLMKRRAFLQTGVALAVASRLQAALSADGLQAASGVLARAAEAGQIDAAALFVQHRGEQFSHVFGEAAGVDAIFLLASISKPISIAAVMALYDRGEFDLEDRVQTFLPEFAGDGRERVTIRHLLTHVCGLPDQLPENAKLRSSHAPLSAFVDGAVRTPLLFAPGEKYSYSSMGILLACEIARRITGEPIARLVETLVYEPLGMKHSAMGLGRFSLDEVVLNQTASAAPESGAGDASTKTWDWNSPYWRRLGVPWGGAHGSAPDVARFLDEFLHPSGRALKPSTAQMMVTNHNPPGLRRRGLGFDVGAESFSAGCSERTFGHTGSTGTLCWADPQTETICVVLTTLPGRAVEPHPRKLASDLVAKAAQ
jgi:CubicO group peptidase (beta-lactamase class C family)